MLLSRSSLLIVSLVLCTLCGAVTAPAQVQLEVSLSRRSYILYESITATITIVNHAGQDLEFTDVPGKQWFNVEMYGSEGEPIPPYDPDYKLSPLTVPAGQSVKRKIDLTPLFPVRDIGAHHIRANLYLASADRFFYSNNALFDLTDGHVLWQQTVGTPAGGVRQMSLLSHHQFDRIMLYVRVRDADGPNVYTTQPIGRVLTTGSEPQTMLDSHNVLHVIHEAVPRAYYYTQVGTDGARLGQSVYTSEGQNRPHLVKMPSGEVQVRGGKAQEAGTTASEAVSPTRGLNGPDQPKLSDRPAGLPPKSERDDGPGTH